MTYTKLAEVLSKCTSYESAILAVSALDCRIVLSPFQNRKLLAYVMTHATYGQVMSICNLGLAPWAHAKYETFGYADGFIHLYKGSDYGA